MSHPHQNIFSDWKDLFLLMAIVAMLALTSTPAAAQIWLASTGTVDDGSLSTFEFSGGNAGLRSSVATGFAIIRYNVLPMGGDAITDPSTQGRDFIVRFRDNGSGAQVLVTLKRYNVHTGQVTTLLSFNSNSQPPQSGFHQSTLTGCGSFFNFSFATGPVEGSEDFGGDSLYYIEAKLSRTASGGAPGLATIRLVTLSCP